MNKKFLYIAVAALGATVLGSCDNEMALPPIAEPESEWAGMENTSVQQIKEQYWQNTANYNTPVNLTGDNPGDGVAEGEEVIIKGRVISSDATGNIYNNIVVRGEDGYAMTIAARTASSSKKLSDQYPYGCEVFVNLSGLSVGRYAGLFQVGAPSGTEITFLSNEVLTQHMQANSIGYPSRVDTLDVDIATLTAAKSDLAQMQYWMSQLIRVSGLTFENAGQPFAASQNENRYAKDANGARINVRCSSRSTWHNDIIPAGTGSVTGILSYFNNDWQLMLNDPQGCEGFEPAGENPGPTPDPTPSTPEGEGTAASPYNVAKALEVIAAGPATTNVYVKGKITAIKEIDTGSYGNATYDIADTEGGKTLRIFRGYWLDGAKFTAADQLAVGADVVVCGVIENYMGNTPEMKQGNKIISYNGQGGTTPEPTPDPTPDPDAKVVASVAEIIALESGTKFATSCSLTVGWVSFKNVFVCDGNGDFIQIYNENSLKVGDVIPAGLQGTYELFNGVTPEITNATIPAATAGTFEPAVVAAADITTALVNSVVKIKNVVLAEASPSAKENFTGKAGDVTLNLRNNYTLESVPAGTYDITVVVNVFQGSTSLYVTKYEATK